jgi:hypothetical protein
MKRSRIAVVAATGAICALGGAAAGIAESSASSSSTPRAQVPLHAGVAKARHAMVFGIGPLKDAAGPPVHSETVFPNDKGGFDTITMDQGSFASLSGDQLTITEGTSRATYKKATLTIPSGATVRRNDEKAQLSDLKAGDTVLVAQGPDGTVVDAHDAEHAEGPKLGKVGPGEPPVVTQKYGSAPSPPTQTPPPDEEGAS